MTSQNHPVLATAGRFPAVIVAPLATIGIPMYPAIWNPSQSVRQVATTFMVIGVVWLVLAAVTTMRRWVVEFTAMVIGQQIHRIRSEAMAELDAHADTKFDVEWNAIVRRFPAPE